MSDLRFLPFPQAVHARRAQRRRDRRLILQGILIGVMLSIAVLYFAEMTIVPIGAVP